MKISGATLHPKQKEIFNSINKSNAKYFIINASRQSGKSFLLAEFVRYFALNEPDIILLYVTPSYGLSDIFFNNIYESLKDIPVIKSINRSKLTLKFINGSSIIFKSAERYDNIRGGSYDYVLLDEFSFFKYGAFDAIKPTIAAKINAKVIIASTPKGKNLFYDMAMLGQSENKRYEYYFMHYSHNPLYDIEEVKDARKVLPEDVFKTEYEAEFIDNGGTVFKDITDVQIVTKWADPLPNTKYFAGLDIGKKDSTVLTIMDKDGKVVYIHRVNNMSYNKIIDSLLVVLNKYNPLVYVEVNSVGDVVFDMLQMKYKSLVTWTNTNKVKTDMIEMLILEMSNRTISLPTEELSPQLDFEMKVFTYEYNPKNRTIRYAATPPHNDDMVISLALANLCKNENMFYGKRITQKRVNKYSY